MTEQTNATNGDPRRHRREKTDQPTIQVLVKDDAEREAISQLLKEWYRIETSSSLQDADLYLVEERTLPEYVSELQTHIENQYPQFVPVVVIRRPGSQAVLPNSLETEPPRLVDDVLDAPLSPAQTFRRIESLLALRGQTRELHDALQDLEEANRRLERYERLVENIPIGVLRTTPEPDGEYRLVNQGAVDIFGADSKEHLLDTPVADTHLDPDGRRSFSSHLQDEEVTEGHELRLQTLKGDPFWGELSGIATEEDGETVFDLVLQDVTERKQYERELEKSRERLQVLFQEAPDAIIVHDEAGSVLDTNESAVAHLGYSRDELLSMNVAEFDADHSIDELEEMWAAMEVGQTTEVESKHERKDGSQYHVEVWISKIEVHNEHRFLGLFRDITERKEYEQRLESQRDGLELLNQIVRHDIRNDLQLVQGYADLLESHVGEEGKQHLRTISKNVDNAVSLTKSARDLTDVLLQSSLEKTTVPLKPTLRTQIDETRAAHDGAVIEVEGSLPKTDVIANEMLSSVFRNLLNNAINHNDKAVPEVTVSTEAQDDFVTVRVADNGPGVPDELKEEIFGKGEKGLESEGTGIGLYLVQSVVEAYDGDVWVEDNEPEGAVFNVKLRIAK